MTNQTAIEVRRAELAEHRIVTEPVPPLGDNQALLRVDHFGLTANNITYGVAGDMIGYWQFFPPSEEGWGRIPVWGFAQVIESNVDAIAPGERVFGYFPMGTHLVVTPTRVNAEGFIDAAEHRASLPAAYNGYRFTSADPVYQPDTEGHQIVFWPLFMTGFLLDSFLAANADFEAATVVVASASSKTALGMAFCLGQRDGARPHVVGLTSPGNVAFVEHTGCYDQVLTYDAVAQLDSTSPTVFVDMAGDAAVRSAVHHHYGDQLTYSCAVGITHWEGFTLESEPLPGPAPQMFFAPSAADFSDGGVQERFATRWQAFLAVVDDWITLRESRGPEAAAATYTEVLTGATRPDVGQVVSLHP
jgi:NADPH:quinone reductase-like Zn-dependent oxidoreductase